MSINTGGGNRKRMDRRREKNDASRCQNQRRAWKPNVSICLCLCTGEKTGVKVLIDPLFWGTSLRRYQLEEFHITGTKRLVGRLQDYILGFGPRNGRRFKDRYRQYLIQKKFKLFQEKQIMHYDADVYKQTQPCFYFGFWQAPKYFEEYYEELKKNLPAKRLFPGRRKSTRNKWNR